MRGLFGLEIDGVANHVRFAPHIPAEWNETSIENIRLPHSTLGFKVSQSSSSFDVKITNEGLATTATFEPQLPLGAQSLKAEFNGQKISASVEVFSGDEHARVTLSVPPGSSLLSIRFQGGVSLLVDHPALHIGDPSSQLKIVELKFRSHVLSVEADVGPGSENKLRIRTPWAISAHQGADVRSLSPYVKEVTIERTNASLPEHYGYTRQHFELTFSY